MGLWNALAGLFQPVLNFLGLHPSGLDEPMQLHERFGRVSDALRERIAYRRALRRNAAAQRRALHRRQMQRLIRRK